MGRFDTRVAIITGAASGMGRATALRFAEDGAKVFGVDIDDAGLQSLAAELGEGHGVRRTDVSSREDCLAAVAACAESIGTADMLLNVAGVLRMGHFRDLTQSELDLMVGVNLVGTIWMCQAALPGMLELNRGSIVNVASNAGLMGSPYAVAYGATKAGVTHFTKGLAMEVVRSAVRVNCVAPGGVDTPMTHAVGLPEDLDFKLLAPAMGFRGMADATELAAILAFVASDEARQIHGAVISADSGLTAG